MLNNNKVIDNQICDRAAWRCSADGYSEEVGQRIGPQQGKIKIHEQNIQNNKIYKIQINILKVIVNNFEFICKKLLFRVENIRILTF
jgi:hypothetical protein